MKNRRGAAIIEFTVIFPLLIILLFGIMEFGIIVYDKAMITNASREGARAGIVMAVPRLDGGQIRTIVRNYCGNHLISFPGGTGPTIPDDHIDVQGAGGAYPDELIVTVTYDYAFLVIPRFVTTFGLGPITLTSRTVMRME